jgi:hypothetical protein
MASIYIRQDRLVNIATMNPSPQQAEHKIHCPVHGKRPFAVFLMPKEGSYRRDAHYECALCVTEAFRG